MPRALEFAKRYSKQIKLALEMQFEPLAAEDILGKSIKTIIGVRKEEYTTRLNHEVEGLQKIRAGTYKDYCLTRDFEQIEPIIYEHAISLLTKDELAQLG